MKLKRHRFNIFPEMQPDDYNRLKSDMVKNGYDPTMPIVLYQGDIIDGWNRFNACCELGIEPVTTDYKGSDSDAIEYIMRTNKRRNLNSSQWACIATEAEEMLRGIAEAVEVERRKKQAETQSETKKELAKVQQIEPQPKDNSKLAAQKAAELFNTNRTYISEAQKLKDTAPEVFEQVKNGLKTITEVKKEQKSIEIARKREEYQERISTRAPDNLFVDIFNTAQKFRIIYADPPWSYNDKCDKGGVQSGGVELRHYNTMSIKEMCDIPIKNISEDNSVLFLWVTSPLLEDSFSIINAWGFKYKTSFVWDKVGHNMGHYNSVRHEMLLIATKGSCTPDNKTLYDSVQSIEKTDKHSQKPIEFLNIIDDLYIYGDRIELFARERQKDGWFLWGNEI